MFPIFIDDKYIYSIEMIYAYINIFKLEQENINLDKLLFNLNLKCWTNNLQPITVINNIKNSQYKEQIDKINKSDSMFPIIINEHGIIIDGMYVLAKAKLENKKTVKTYTINTSLMKKFRILKNNEIDKIKTIQIHNHIELFVKNIFIDKIDENKHLLKYV